MGTLLLERPALFDTPAPSVERAAPTLSDLVGGAWEGLEAGAAVACPVCGDLMLPQDDEGRCRSCDSALQ